MMLKELILQGWQALMRNRMRSVLTMLGITWGLVSVVILLAYGQGLGGGILAAFSAMGNNVIVLWPGQTSMQAGGQRAGRKIKYEYADIEAIRAEIPLVRAVSAESTDQLPYKLGTRVVSVQTRGVELPYGQMRRLEIEDGRYFDASDFTEHRRVVILGYDASKKVFQGAPAVGQSVEIGGQMFEVIGTLKQKIQDSMYEGPDNQDGFIPFNLYRDLKSQRDPDMIVFQPLDPTLDLKTLAAVRSVIARRHHFNPKDDKATPEWNTIETKGMIRAFGLGLQVILGVIGALTLGVGGVGVMNIMLVSVTERTREIGLRKALGAKRLHILTQFLLEALVLTFIGGLAGIALSVLMTHAIPPLPLYSALYKTANHEGDIFLHMSISVVTVSFIILALVGVTSGFWPAWKAARLSPIEALRYD
ncbi:MAG TPA: ABC transporter permease [Terriglobales bacterium]|nr:ABC transporter permease [Terriglobales bacterium]